MSITHVLTIYATTMGIQKKSESDHNIMYAKFKMKVQREQKQVSFSLIIWNLRKCSSMKFERDKEIFSDVPSFEQNSRNLLLKLNSIFHRCLKRIRKKY